MAVDEAEPAGSLTQLEFDFHVDLDPHDRIRAKARQATRHALLFWREWDWPRGKPTLDGRVVLVPCTPHYSDLRTANYLQGWQLESLPLFAGENLARWDCSGEWAGVKKWDLLRMSHAGESVAISTHKMFMAESETTFTHIYQTYIDGYACLTVLKMPPGKAL